APAPPSMLYALSLHDALPIYIFQAADFRQHDAFGSGDCYRQDVVEVIDVLQAVDADVDALARIGERGDHRGGIFTRNLLVMYRDTVFEIENDRIRPEGRGAFNPARAVGRDKKH